MQQHNDNQEISLDTSWSWWHRLEIRDLRCFVALAEEMHFGRAAQRLNLAQPVLSRKIARLEGDLGGQLFDRTRAQIKLTPAGTTLLLRVRDVLRRFGEMAEETRNVAGGKQGVLEVGFVSSATFSVLPDLVREYHRRYPMVEVGFRHMNKAMLFHALIERRVHAAITRGGIDDAEVVNILVSREEIILAIPDGNPLARARVVDLADLTEMPFVIPKQAVDDQIRRVCTQAGFKPTIVQEPEDLHTSLSLVAAGLGVALVPESARKAPRTGVAYRNIGDLSLQTEFVLSYRRDNADPLLRMFRSVIKQATLQKPGLEGAAVVPVSVPTKAGTSTTASADLSTAGKNG